MEILYLGHSCFKVMFKNASVLIDPYFFTESQDSGLKPLFKAPCQKENLRDIDLILLTHEHFDHFDKAAVEYLAGRDNAVVLAHDSLLKELSLPRALQRAVSVDSKEQLRGVEIEVMPAHHPNAFYPMGFIVSADGQRLFHAGDTTLTDSFEGVKVDVALLPIGGTYTMDLIDAVRATKTIKPELVIPMHYNTFDVIKADPADFKRRIEKSLLKTKPAILEPGETYVYE